MLTISLSDEEAALVRAQIESGEYASPHEVIHAALELQEAYRRSQQLNQELQTAVDQYERGEFVEFSREWFEGVKQLAHEDFLAERPVKDIVKP